MSMNGTGANGCLSSSSSTGSITPDIVADAGMHSSQQESHQEQLPSLHHGFLNTLKAFPNKEFLGVRYINADGTPGACFEFETYR